MKTTRTMVIGKDFANDCEEIKSLRDNVIVREDYLGIEWTGKEFKEAFFNSEVAYESLAGDYTIEMEN